MTTELRKWAIEQAVLSKSKDVVKDAQSYLDFVALHDKLTTKAKQDEQDARGEESREWSPKKLSDAKTRVMQNVHSRFKRELPINGAQIAKDLGMTQSNASVHLVDLVRDGYIARQGNKFWPLRTLTGKLMPVIVHQVPRGIAQGYTGVAKAQLGEIARKA